MKLAVPAMVSLEKDQVTFLNEILTRLTHAINNIEFGTVASSGLENIWCTFITTPGDNAADKAVSASHALTRKPMGTVVVWADKAANLYKPTEAASADTSTAVFYKFDTASTSAVLLLF